MSARSRLVAVPHRLDLRGTLRPLTSPWGRMGPDGWWRALRSPDGPAGLRLRREDGGVRAEAWGPGAGWALDLVPDLIGHHDDPGSFRPDHPVVAELHRRAAGLRLGRTRLVFEALVVAIVTQKVTGAEARRGLAGISRRFSRPAPGIPGLWLPPDPDALAAAPYHLFHDLGIEKRRADTLRRAAASARRLDALGAVEPAPARRRLEALPGVGAWTSAETVAISHGDPDAVSVGDFHLKNTVAWHLAGRPRGTDDEMLELLEPFRPHRGRVVRLLEGAGPAPRFGPRLAPRSFIPY